MGAGGHQNVAATRLADANGMRVVTWSTVVECVWAGSEEEELAELDLKVVATNTQGALCDVVMSDVGIKRGGNIVHVHGDGCEGVVVDVIESVGRVQDRLGVFDKFKCASLEDAVVKDIALEL